MSTIKSVMLAIEGAMRARELAAKDLTRIQLHVVSAQGQLDQLEHYAADTEARWGNSSRTQTTAELMRHHYQFLDRLHHAIGLQRGVMQNLADQAGEAKNALIQLELRLASLKKIETRQRHLQTAQEDRREQRQMDELAAVQHTKLARYRPAGGQT
mgnify:FL=1